jgi:hypothetical protein
MLETLRKALGGKEAAKQPEQTEVKQLSAEDVTVAVQAAVAELQGQFDEFKQNAEAAMAEAAEKITGLQAELTEAKAALDAADAAKAEAEATALAARAKARKEKVVAAIGTERADALLAVTEGMDDAAFEAVVGALGASTETEAAKPLFNEVGADGGADAAKVEESPEMKILRAKYKTEQK